MFRIVLLFISSMMISVVTLGQTDSVALRMQEIKVAANDSLKMKYADEIPAYLENIEFGRYPTLPSVQFLGYKRCMNAEAELFSWAVPTEEGQLFYNWFRFKDGNKKYLLKSLSVLKEGKPSWLYYDMIGFEHKGEPYFVLLGWNKTRNSNQKIVQIVRFEDHDVISFNHALMRRGNSRSASLSFEYAKDGSMMLKQDKKGKRIIFDHLAPSDKKYEGYFMFYGPDASYDALILKGGEWWYQEKVEN